MKIFKYIAYSLLGIALASCNDSFMDRYPETDISDKNFFKSVKDLETYVNGFYGYLSAGYGEEASDDMTDNQSPYIYRVLRGEINPKTVGEWNWERIRNINFFLENCHKVKGDESEINHNIGIARLNRAWEYYNKVRSYSDVPWYTTALETTSPELYNKQDPRAFVVDKILEDLEFAVTHVKDNGSKTRYNKWSALALQARIALEEASWRKYHKELELDDADRFYEIAITATQKIMDSGKFALNTTGKDGFSAYKSNFVSYDLSQNTEMIMYAKFAKGLRMHNSQAMLNNYHGLSKDLMEEFLYVENNVAKPFNQVPNYNKKTFLEVFENRDSRFGDVFMKPGYIRADSKTAMIPKLGLGGYPVSKFDPLTYDQIGWYLSYNDLPMIRYAEILLINAEAKAELGVLTEEDVDKTINVIRDRANTPRTSLNNMLSNIDPDLENKYSNVKGDQRGAILEIRREKRVEFAAEGKRLNDVYRWNVGKKLEQFEGMYVDQLGYLDLTGDGKPDVAIVKNQQEADQIPETDKEKYKLVVYVLEGNTFYLSEGDHGYIRMTSFKDKLKFDIPKDYYTPISELDKVLNPNLIQNKFW